MSHDKFEIEKEYDNRYEGLDFDDIDETGRNIFAESQREEGEESVIQVDGVDGSDGDIFRRDHLDDRLDALEKAEQREEEQKSQERSKADRFLDRLHNKMPYSSFPTTNARSSTVTDSTILNCQQRLASAISSNKSLSHLIRNPHAVSSSLVLSLVPDGTSKTTALAKVAAHVRLVQKATDKLSLPSINNLDAFSVHSSSEFKTQVEEILDNSSKITSSSSPPGAATECVYSLLRLAAVPITPKLLSPGTGKRMRKISKTHGVESIKRAASVVVESWRCCLTTTS